MSCIKFTNIFGWELIDVDGRVLRTDSFHNNITTEGIHDLLDVYFDNGSVAAAWYIGLIDSSGFSQLSIADTMASHAGWIEITSEYDEATRPLWGPDAAASQTKANSTKAIVTFNAPKVVTGLFIATENTKGGTTGTLWATGLGDVEQSVIPGQALKLKYELNVQEG